MATFAIAAELASMNIVILVTACAIFPQADLVFDRVTMTGETFQCFMGSIEPELGLRIVVVLPEVPAVRVVAIGTVVSKALLMHIILFVAVAAVASGVLEVCPEVTTFTGRNRMQTDQRETGQVVFESHVNPPAALVVTVVALLSLLPLVRVVKLMAAETVQRQLFSFSGTGMAFVAVDLVVLVAKREFGFVVVELELFPAFGLMATFALVAISAAVQVLRLMTRNAVKFQLLIVESTGMTHIALHLGVFVPQAKLGLVVVEQDGLPCRLLFCTGFLCGSGRSMTGLALFPIAACVVIVQAVTGVAVVRNIFPVLIRVAKTAGNLLMSSFKFEFGLLMFEAVF